MAPNTPTFDRPPDIPLPAVTDDVGYLLKWFWVIKLGLFVHIDDPVGQQLTEKQFNETYADIPLPTVNTGGRRNRRQGRVTPSQFIREHNRDARVVTYMDSVGMALDPARGGGTHDLIWRDPATGVKILNIFPRPPSPPSDMDADPEGLDLFLDSLLFICNGDEDIRLHLLKWITNIVFRPWQRMNHGVLISGHQGTGKSTVAEVMKVLVGDAAFANPRPADLLNEKFNDYLLNSRLCVVEEIMEPGNYSLYNRLKVVFTNQRIRIESKHQKSFEVENITNLLFFSNHAAAMNIEEGDRRLFPIWSDASAEDARQKKEEGYFRKLRDWLGLDGARETYEGIWFFRKYLEEQILPDLPEDFHVSQPPETEAKSALIEASKHPIEAWLDEQFYSEKGRFAPKKFGRRSELWDELEHENLLKPFLKNRTLVLSILKKYGYSQKRFAIFGDRDYWCWFDQDGFGKEFSLLIADTTKDGRMALAEFYVGYEFTTPFRPHRIEGYQEDGIGNHVLGEDF